MRRDRLGRALVIVLAAFAGWTMSSGQSPAPKPYTTWSDGSSDSMQYSALTQITKENVNQLELAWFHPVPDRRGTFGFNPIVVDGVYVFGLPQKPRTDAGR